MTEKKRTSEFQTIASLYVCKAKNREKRSSERWRKNLNIEKEQELKQQLWLRQYSNSTQHHKNDVEERQMNWNKTQKPVFLWFSCTTLFLYILVLCSRMYICYPNYKFKYVYMLVSGTRSIKTRNTNTSLLLFQFFSLSLSLCPHTYSQCGFFQSLFIPSLYLTTLFVQHNNKNNTAHFMFGVRSIRIHLYLCIIIYYIRCI